jgi:hypothetical protein
MFDNQIGVTHGICEDYENDYIDKEVWLMWIAAEIYYGINCGYLTEKLKNLL